MTRPGIPAIPITLAAAAIMATGCVPQDRYDSLMTTNRSLEEQLVNAQAERDESRAALQAAQDRLRQMRGSYDSLQSKYDELSTGFGELEDEYDANLRRITQLEIGPLPRDVESAIEDLAMAHPGLLTFDPRLGMVRFASDFTFDLGSVALQSTAADTIASLADILNDPAAQVLEVKVIGHTDNVRIGKPETRRNHPTNTHLSVHRAIAVRDALVQAGVDPIRIQVAGYGEYRPIVPNGRKGAAENRRVEIFLAPMPEEDMRRMASPSADTSDPSAVATEPDEIEPMK
jgi:chemotaxis protein MotB